MDNPNILDSGQESKNNFEGLISERKKTIANCLNLECKNEQLKILIEKLHKIARQREDLLLKIHDNNLILKDADHLYLKNTSISDELKQAKANSKDIEKSISKLKEKINKIDISLSNKKI